MKSLWDVMQFYKRFYNVVLPNAIFYPSDRMKWPFRSMMQKMHQNVRGCLFWEEKRNREGGNNFEWKNQKNDKDLKKVSWNRMEEMKFSQHNLTKVRYIGRSKNV